MLNYAEVLTGFHQGGLFFIIIIFFCRHDGTESPADAGDVTVLLNSFHSKVIKVRVSVLLTRGSLLQPPEVAQGFWALVKTTVSILFGLFRCRRRLTRSVKTY